MKVDMSTLRRLKSFWLAYSRERLDGDLPTVPTAAAIAFLADCIRGGDALREHRHCKCGETHVVPYLEPEHGETVRCCCGQLFVIRRTESGRVVIDWEEER